MSKKQRPEEIYDVPNAGFDFHHKPEDAEPCKLDEFGRCNSVPHLFPIAKGVRQPKAKS